MRFQESPSTPVYSMVAGGASVGVGVGVATAVGVGVGWAVALATGGGGVGLTASGVTGWGEACGITIPAESLGTPGGRTSSQSARTLQRSRGRRGGRERP